MTVHLDSPLPPAAALSGAAQTRQGNPLLREAQAGVMVAAPAPPPTEGALVHISAQGLQSLGQAAAALQNQNTLLQALGTSTQTGTPAPTMPAAMTPAPTGPATPSVVPVALETPPTATASTPAVPTTNSSSNPSLPANALVQTYSGGRAQLPALVGHFGATTTSQTSSTTEAEAVATPAMHWPSQGVGKPLYTLVQTLVQQATASLGTQRVLAAQHWPAALVPVVDPQPPAQGEPDLAPLQTWLVHQGIVQTREGPRGVSVTLRVPVPWLRAWEQAQASAMPSPPGNDWIGNPLPAPEASAAAAQRPLQALFAGPSANLQSGTVALALESPGMTSMRTSALLLLEFQPLLRSSASTQANALYGHHATALHLRQDPWLQMAMLQASGHVRHEEEDMVHASAALCDTPGCPYQGETACVQPFCMVLRALAPIDALEAGSHAPGPHAPGLR
ncbi:MAG: hypothetical protein K2Y10_11875 [Burkholderiaceae bacterium]|nr:hypothetical protein [Burkholderiaceae bacterium]